MFDAEQVCSGFTGQNFDAEGIASAVQRHHEQISVLSHRVDSRMA
jgi:hypothetical protein